MAAPRYVAILTAPSSPGRVPPPHATWLSAPTAHFTARSQPALRAGSVGLTTHHPTPLTIIPYNVDND